MYDQGIGYSVFDMTFLHRNVEDDNFGVRLSLCNVVARMHISRSRRFTSSFLFFRDEIDTLCQLQHNMPLPCSHQYGTGITLFDTTWVCIHNGDFLKS